MEARASYPTPDPEQLRRRIKAARTLAGLDSAEALAEALQTDAGRTGYSRRSVVKLETETEYVPAGVIRDIARVCRLPEAFFYVDFDRLDELPASLAERLAKLDANIAKLLNQYLEDRVRLARAAPDPPSAQAGDPKRNRGR